MKRIRVSPRRMRGTWLGIIALVLILSVAGLIYVRRSFYSDDFEVTDQLGGNIFPSAILSVATTEAQVIKPVDSLYIGNPKSGFGVRLKSGTAYSRVRIEVGETPFFTHSVSEFVLPRSHTVYTIYPDIVWRYDALRNNAQARPISVVIRVELNGRDMGQKVRTFAVRSINECLLGYVEPHFKKPGSSPGKCF